MKYANPRLRSILAAQYALGTLRGPARRRWERLARDDVALRAEQRRWEARLANLGLRLAPVVPREVVWAGIDRAINAAAPAAVAAAVAGAGAGAGAGDRSVRLWRAWAIAASVAVVALALGLVREINRPPTVIRDTEVVRVEVPQPLPYVALLQTAAADARWLVSLSPEKGLIKVSMHGRYAELTPQQALELWYLDAAGQPHSLGLLPVAEGEASMPMPRDASMPARPTLAVSLEPAGGSPSGLPTGPVILTAPALRAS